MSGDRYDMPDSTYLQDGILRCRVCRLPVSQCDCEYNHLDDDDVGRTSSRPNHFAAAVDHYIAAHPSDTKFAAEVLATMGYSAICQHLAELTEVLDRIAARRSS